MKKNKKQSVVSRSSAKSEYITMANVTLKLIWIKDLLIDIGFFHRVSYETIW